MLFRIPLPAHIHLKQAHHLELIILQYKDWLIRVSDNLQEVLIIEQHHDHGVICFGYHTITVNRQEYNLSVVTGISVKLKDNLFEGR